MSQLTQILTTDLQKLKDAVHKLFAHADDVNAQQNRQRIRNEGTGGAGQQNEKNTLKLEEVKNDVKAHLDRILATTETHAELSAPQGFSAPIAPRMRCKVLVIDVHEDKDFDGKVTGERYTFTGVGGDKVQHGYPEDGSDEDNDFSRWSPSVSQEIYCTNPALFGTIIVGERYYVDFTLANGVPILTPIEEKPAASNPLTAADFPGGVIPSVPEPINKVDSGSLTTAEPETNQAPTVDPNLNSQK